MSSKQRVIDLFQSKGLLFPETEAEIGAFELVNNIEHETPADWDNPEEILKRGRQTLKHIKLVNEESLGSEIEELRMVARKGNNLPQHVIDKMKEAQQQKNDQ